MHREIQSLESLYNAYSAKVRAYIASRVSNAMDAEDLCSDVFVKVSEHIGAYDPGKASYGTWIYTITQNTVRDYFRRAKRNTDMPLPEELPLADLHADVEADILREENLEMLADALEKLSERERDVILLRFYHELSPREVADRLQISYANARYIQSVALKKLRELLPLLDS